MKNLLKFEILGTDRKDRERIFKYAHINLILFPDYHIELAGTGSELISDRTQKCIGNLFLYWDNQKIILGKDIKGFSGCIKRLEENGFIVEFGK